jgi:hypothetical protein
MAISAIPIDEVKAKRKRLAAAMSAAEIRAEISKLGSKAVDVLEDILDDASAPRKLRADIAMYVLDTTLDDPVILQNSNDTLVKLAEVLRAQNGMAKAPKDD